MLAVVLTLTALAYGVTAAMRVPPPHQLASIVATLPSEQGQIFPSRPVENFGEVRPFAVAGSGTSAGTGNRNETSTADGTSTANQTGESDRTGEGDRVPAIVPRKGSDIPLDEMLDVTNSRAFLVVHDGKIVHEWYSEGVGGESRLSSWSVAKVNDRPLSEVASTDLWTPLGAESGATWNLDREGGTEKGFCCLNATARDFAKIGQMVLDNGRVGDTQVVPAEWIERISTPSGLKLGDWNYSAQWWHAPTSDGDFTALGVYGQYIYIDPDANTVIVKLSDHGTEQDEIETVDAMRFIAEELARRDS